jgi:predicted PurR-regulated permease PerM
MDTFSPKWQRGLIILASVVLIVAALYLAQAVLIPVVMAIVLTFILSPAVTALQRRGFHRIPAAIVVVFFAVVVVSSVGLLLAAQVVQLSRDWPLYKDQIGDKLTGLRDASQGSWLDPVTHMVNDISATLKEFEKDTVSVRLKDSRLPFLRSIAESTISLLVSLGLVILLLVFMLIQREDLRNRILRLWGDKNLTSTTKALDDAGRRISRFLLMQLFINASYGAVLALGLFVIGVPHALIWGILAATLRYIPYVGPVVGALLPLVVAVAALPTWTPFFVALGFITVLELVSNNFMEPWLYGRSIGVSEVALLVAAAFWTWLWGPVGLVLSTPLTACLAVLGRYVPQLACFDILLGDEPALEPSITYYQRLLAKDQDEATDLVEDYLKKGSVDTVFDDLLVPALVLAERQHERGDLSREDRHFVMEGTREVLYDVVSPQRETLQGDNEDPEATPERAVRGTVFGLPVRDEGDELALNMLAQLLDPSKKCRFEVVSSETLFGEVVTRINDEEPGILFLGSLAVKRLARTRYVCKRLRAQFPEHKILVGYWGSEMNPERVRERLQAAGADEVSMTLQESRHQLVSRIQIQPVRPDAKALVHAG